MLVVFRLTPFTKRFESNFILQVDTEMRQGAELFAHLKQLLKLFMRQRDKAMMLQMIEEVPYHCLSR
jgi:hypothetical protein